MRKRILLGTIIGLSTPLATVIACSNAPGSQFTDKDKELLAKIKTNEFKQAIENEWIKKVINKEYTDKAALSQERKKVAEFIIENNLQKKPDYLVNLATQLRKSANNSTEEDEIAQKVEEFGFNDIYYSKSWNNSDAIDWLLSEENQKRIDIYKEVQKILIIKKYFELDKNNWEKVFENEEEGKLSSLEKALVDQNFPLLKEAVAKNYFLKWNTKLSEDKSLGLRKEDKDLTKSFTGNDNADQIQTDTIENFILKWRNGTINKNTQINNFVDYYGVKASLFDTGQDLSTFKQRPGFENLGTVPSGRSELDFSLEGWKRYRKSPNFVQGYLQENKLVKAQDYKIEGKSFDLTKVLGILPYYNTKDEKNKIEFDTIKFNLDNVAILFAINNGALFDEAVKYYTKKENPINITLGVKYLNQILEEEGNPYIVKTPQKDKK